MDPKSVYIQSRDRLLLSSGLKYNSRFATITGPVKQVHYLEAGRGPDLVLLHGGGSHSGEWMNILKPLAEHFHLYVVDRPGCGLTDDMNYRSVDFRLEAVRFIERFMDAAGIQKAGFLAQSMGGYFSICFATEHPERVEKLILIGAPAGVSRRIPFLLRALGTKGLNNLLTRTVARPGVKNMKFVHSQLLVADAEKIPEAYFEHGYHHQLLWEGRNGFKNLLENVLTFRGWRKDLYVGDQLHKIQVPVRFIWGEKDVFESPASGRKKAESIRDMKFEVVEDAGHSPWLDQPDKCVELIIKMMNE